MDGQRFDNLTRTLATACSRRRVLRVLAGSLTAGLLGQRGAGAAACREAGRLCTKDANCCAPATCDPATRACVCPPGTENCRGACKTNAGYQADILNCGRCGNRCPIDQCNRATCANGGCGLEPNPVRIGQACDDGNRCTVEDVCLANGTCAGALKNCSSQNDQCNDGVCRPSDGACVKQPKPNGTGCETGNRCTADICQTGVCQQGAVDVTCPQPTQCQESVSCNPANGLCDMIVNRQSDFPCETGNLCTADTCNGNGACVQGPVNVTCPSCRTCQGGECVADESANNTSCDTDQICCNGACISAFDPQNCGACGNVCPPVNAFDHARVICGIVTDSDDLEFAAIGCLFICDPEYQNCDGNLANGCEAEVSHDRDNCHMCGFSCPPDHYCCGCDCFPNSSPDLCSTCPAIRPGRLIR